MSIYEYDLIERWATATNEGEAPIMIERMLSAEWHLPPGDGYRLSHMTGRWADEMNLRRDPLIQGLKVQYVSKDKAEGVLLVFRTHIPRPANLPPLYLRGLVPDARYAVEGFAGARSGRAWMEAGLSVELEDFGSMVRRMVAPQDGVESKI